MILSNEYRDWAGKLLSTDRYRDGNFAICATVFSQYMYKKGFKSEELAQQFLDAMIEKAAMSWQWSPDTSS